MTKSSTNHRVGVWPTARSTARALGVRHYMSDLPCPQGHVGLRITKTGNCLTCKREAERESGLARLNAFNLAGGRDLRKVIDATYHASHREARNAKKRETRAFNRYMLNLDGAL